MSEDQELRRKDDIKQLAQTIKEFRDDELEHLDTAVEQEAKSVRSKSANVFYQYD
ncbi:ubiquinone biosynthesis monooxygenase Coq7 [Sorochytrium milnesiophthora]